MDQMQKVKADNSEQQPKSLFGQRQRRDAVVHGDISTKKFDGTNKRSRAGHPVSRRKAQPVKEIKPVRLIQLRNKQREIYEFPAFADKDIFAGFDSHSPTSVEAELDDKNVYAELSNQVIETQHDDDIETDLEMLDGGRQQCFTDLNDLFARIKR